MTITAPKIRLEPMTTTLTSSRIVGMDDALSALGFSKRQEGSQYFFEGPLSGVTKLVEMTRAGTLKYNKPHNRDKAMNQITTNDDSWCGGSLEQLEKDMAGFKDLTAQKKAMAELSSSGFVSALDLAVEDVVPRRKRLFDDTEGDWMMDRKWEIKPFARTNKQNSASHVLHVDAMFSANCNTEAKAMNAYGAVIWAVVNIIEARGICVELNCVHQGQRLFGDSNECQDIRTLVKSAGTYLAPNLMAAVFQTNFMRRMAFAEHCIVADAFGKSVDSNLGKARDQSYTARTEGSTLYLSPKIIGGKTAEDTSKALIDCLKQMKRGASNA